MAYLTSTWYLNYGNGSSTGYYAVPAWTALTPYIPGSLVRQLVAPSLGNERVFVQVTATTHTSGASEPTWVVTKGALSPASGADGTCHWYEVTGQPGVNGDLTNCPVWTVSSTPPLGMVIYDSVSASLQICTTSGAGGTGSAPTFSATGGTTTTDASATWTSLGLATAFTAVPWGAPHARLANVYGTGWFTTGTIYAGSNHAETQSSAAINITLPGVVNLVSVPVTVAPPTTVAAGASITTTGANALTVLGTAGTTQFNYYYGITFSAGSGATNSILTVGKNNYGNSVYDSCTFAKPGTTGIATAITTEGSNVFKNCSFSLGSTTDNITINYGPALFQDCQPLIASGSAIPTNLFVSNFSQTTLKNCDLTALSTGQLLKAGTYGSIIFNLLNCKIAAGMTYNTQGAYGVVVNYSGVDSAGTNYRFGSISDFGTMTDEETVIKTGGATAAGGTAYSAKIVTTANSDWQLPFVAPSSVINNTLIGTNRVVQMSGIWNSASLPNNDQIWIHADYLGSATSPLGSHASETKANILAAGVALAADTNSAWDSQGPARLNSNAYTVGNTFTVPSNPGQRFYVVSGSGNSAASQPAGYATCVDGGSVTDGGWTVRAMVRFLISITLSGTQPAQQGPIYATIKAATPSTTFYVDPNIILG